MLAPTKDFMKFVSKSTLVFYLLKVLKFVEIQMKFRRYFSFLCSIFEISSTCQVVPDCQSVTDPASAYCRRFDVAL